MEKDYKNPTRKYLSISKQVHFNLRQEILRGDLADGTPLKQDLLAQRFGVSVSVLREALKTLEGEGLVEFTTNKGAAVKRLSAQEAEEIFAIRLLLEGEALCQSMEKLTEEDFFALEGILDEEEFCHETERYNDLNTKFHQSLYKHCPNKQLLQLIEHYHALVCRYMLVYLNTLLRKEESQREHRLLLQACQLQDKKAARSLLKRHMQKASKELALYLAQQQAPKA